MNGRRDYEEWKRRLVRRIINTHRAVRPENFHIYGVVEGVYETERGEQVNVEEFYDTIHELSLQNIKSMVDVMENPFLSAREREERWRIHDIRLMILHMAMLGYSDYGVIFPIPILRDYVQHQTEADFLDFVNMYEGPATPTEGGGLSRKHQLEAYMKRMCSAFNVDFPNSRSDQSQSQEKLVR